jgi:hypothetical protein
MKSSHLSRSHQKRGDRVVQSAATWPLAGSLVIEESHKANHYATVTKAHLSLVIFDRDGTLIEDMGYPIDPETISWNEGALEAVAWLSSQGVIVTVATNQSGVARGYFTLGQVYAFHAAMDITIQAEGGRVDAYAICPHLVDGVVAEYAD